MRDASSFSKPTMDSVMPAAEANKFLELDVGVQRSISA